MQLSIFVLVFTVSVALLQESSALSSPIAADASQQLAKEGVQEIPQFAVKQEFPSKIAVPSVNCGGNYTEAKGYITSPNHPLPYGGNLDCIYVIQVPNDSRVRIYFTNFSTENNYDTLEVYDGSAVDASRKLLTASGSYLPPDVVSSSSQMALRFRTDSINNDYAGFTVRFLDWFGFCNGGTYFGTFTGTITSPNYPNLFGGGLDCQYLIQVPSGRVNLRFISLDVNNGWDYVKIYDGTTIASTLLASGTGNSTSGLTSIQSSSNKILVQFTTSNLSFKKGFEAVYSTV